MEFNTETSERYIADSQDILQQRAKFATWLPLLVERLARGERLIASLRVDAAAASSS